MALELRPSCEYCDTDLPPESRDARICSYECTFCARCVEVHLADVCPHCGGGFAPRSVRPRGEWRPGLSLALRPASTERHRLGHSLAEVAALTARLKDVPPHER